jgi:hypothetical protein
VVEAEATLAFPHTGVRTREKAIHEVAFTRKAQFQRNLDAFDVRFVHEVMVQLMVGGSLAPNHTANVCTGTLKTNDFEGYLEIKSSKSCACRLD